MSVDGSKKRKEPISVRGGDPRASRGISPYSPTVDLWYSSWSINSSILLRRSSCSSGPPPRTVEEEAGQADRAMEASTRLRSLCRLSSPWAAKVSMVKGVFSRWILIRPSVLWIFLRPKCCSEWQFTLSVGYTATLYLYTSDRPGSGRQLSGHVQCAFQCAFLVLLLRVGSKGTQGWPLLPERCP